MFTIPKTLIDSVIKSLSPGTRQRHPVQGQGHRERSRSESTGVRTGQNSRQTSSTSQREIRYNQQPQYVSPDSTNYRSGGHQALETSNRGYNTQEAINRYRQGYFGGTGNGGGVNSVGTESDRYRQNEAVKDYDRYSVRGVPSGDTIFDERINSIPDTVYQPQPVDSGQYQTYNNNVEPRKPVLTVPDTIDEVNFHWTISGFTECSTTCGGGKDLFVDFGTLHLEM